MNNLAADGGGMKEVMMYHFPITNDAHTDDAVITSHFA